MVQVDLRTTVSRGASNQSALARTVAEQALAIRFDDIPADVVALAKIHFRDQLGIGLLAATLPRNRPLVALASLFGTGANATALGGAAPVTPAAAALRNGTLMHSLEYDATHTASITPAGSVVAHGAELVTWSPMADGDFSNRYGARVTVTNRSNDRFTAEVEDVRGTPGRPFSEGEALCKFYDCTAPVLRDDAPERLAGAVDQMHRAEDLARAHERFGACVEPVGLAVAPGGGAPIQGA